MQGDGDFVPQNDEDIGEEANRCGAVFTGAIVPEQRANAAGAALAISATDGHVSFSSNGGGAVAMTETMVEGQRVTLVMTAFDTDDYTLAVGGGTLTFNAANEGATIVLDGGVVRVVGLSGATIV
jgi:hypothetical protein